MRKLTSHEGTGTNHQNRTKNSKMVLNGICIALKRKEESYEATCHTSDNSWQQWAVAMNMT